MASDHHARQILGIALLIVVNVVWVLSAELTKFLFIDMGFKRPFFTTFFKSCIFSVFILRYMICGPQGIGPKNESVNYNKLDQSDSESFENESLTIAEFEPITLPSDSDADSQTTPVKKISEDAKLSSRKVRFSLFREVRRLPEKIANEARNARLPYRPPGIECNFKMRPFLQYILYFAPLWLTSSLTYQWALIYSSVSTVNLISASSSLFVLVLSAFFGTHVSDRFSWTKLFLVIINLSGVVIVSQFSAKVAGVVLSFTSALAYAIYLVVFSAVSRRAGGQIDINLMFGVVGIFSFIVFTPLLLILDKLGIEALFPLPTRQEILIILLNSVIGSIFSDYLWLYATLLTSSLVSSISLTLTIPLSLIADVFIRHQSPSLPQLIAAVPITISFLGASFLNSKQSGSYTKPEEFKMKSKRIRDVIFSDRPEEADSLMSADELEL